MDKRKQTVDVPEGAHQDENGFWVDAGGNPLTEDQVAAAEKANKSAHAQPEPIKPVRRQDVKLGEEKVSDLPKPSAE